MLTDSQSPQNKPVLGHCCFSSPKRTLGRFHSLFSFLSGTVNLLLNGLLELPPAEVDGHPEIRMHRFLTEAAQDLLQGEFVFETSILEIPGKLGRALEEGRAKFDLSILSSHVLNPKPAPHPTCLNQ